MKVQDTHIEWIDGAKGVAILSVILLHSLPCLHEIGWIWHIGQAVPIFLFITAYLITSHFESLRVYFRWERITKMLKKVFVPFVIVLFIQIGCMALVDKSPSYRMIFKDGGLGPGSYYVWLYLQIWVIMPFIVLMVRKLPIWVSALIMLIISAIAEYAFVPIQDIENIDKVYRLIPIRYLMLLYLGCIWSTLKDKHKYILYVLGGISALLIAKDIYLSDTLIFNIVQFRIVPRFWDGYHWYTAFYVALPMALLERIKYKDVWKQAGKYSWYIFLLQMMCFGFSV